MTKKESKTMCRLERDARQSLERRKARAFDALVKRGWCVLNAINSGYVVEGVVSTGALGRGATPLEAVENAMQEQEKGL